MSKFTRLSSYINMIRPQLFRDAAILPYMLAWLRPPEDTRRTSATATLGNTLYNRLACNILLRAFRDCKVCRFCFLLSCGIYVHISTYALPPPHIQDWPLEFLQAYMDDALGARSWVEDQDDVGCRTFIANLRTCWNPKAAADAEQGGGSKAGCPMLKDRYVAFHFVSL